MALIRTDSREEWWGYLRCVPTIRGTRATADGQSNAPTARQRKRDMSIEYQSVAIVDANTEGTIVWQVDVSSDTQGSSRMCGAWVLAADEAGKLERLTQARYVVATRAGDRVLRRITGHGHRGVVDLASTLSAVESEIRELQTVFDRAARSSKSNLIVPTWPHLPEAIDLRHPPADASAPQGVAVTLGIARWLEAVAFAWESLERQRLARKYMRGNELTPRALPIRIAG
jgi:hypothetical protein